MAAQEIAGRILLKPRNVRPILLRHPWVFASAVARVDGQPANGDLVSVHDPRGKFLGKGLLSTQSEIRVRLLSWDTGEKIDQEFWETRLREAACFRTEQLKLAEVTDAWRAVNAEGDGLPGLTVDRYGATAVVQFTTFGMARRAGEVVEAVLRVLKPEGVYEKADGTAQKHEGFIRPSAVLAGNVPEEDVPVREGGASFLVSIRMGQKTGFYLDQRDNRMEVGRLAGGLRVLDAFTYTGGFAVHAALGGAREVVAADSSGPALEAARRNASENRLRIDFRQGDVFEMLRLMRLEGRVFDMVILDPPKMAHARAGLAKALRGYKDLNLSAMKLLGPGGLLVTSSCSGLVSREEFLTVVNAAAVDADRRVRIMRLGGQAADHVVGANCPEGRYLKCVMAQVR